MGTISHAMLSEHSTRDTQSHIRNRILSNIVNFKNEAALRTKALQFMNQTYKVCYFPIHKLLFNKTINNTYLEEQLIDAGKN